jgi:hypothetical protein
MDSSGSRSCSAVGPFVHVNENLGTVKCQEFYDQQNGYVACSQWVTVLQIKKKSLGSES